MSTPKKKTVIPNELKITINTSIPGFQTVKYSPNMTIKDISKDDKSIQFNPLIKLNQSAVNKVPENLRIKQFFNPGLFESLLRVNGKKPVSGLEESMFYGIVDNNIKVTLDSIFPTNSVIYIGKNPYVIVDFQLTKGSWKIDTKQKPQPLDSSKITNPYLYAAVVRDELISGEEELSDLPENILYGPNYTGPKDVIVKPVNQEQEKVETKQQPSAPLGPEEQKELPVATPLASGIKQKNVPLLTDTSQSTPMDTQIEPYKPPEKLQLQDQDQLEKEQKQKLLLENKPLESPQIEDVEEKEDNEPVPETKLETAILQTTVLKNFFKQNTYFFILNAIFKFMAPQEQKYIKNILLQTTGVNIKEETNNLSRLAYDQSVQGLTVYKNKGNGDCFFISVADAINYYNYNNPNNKIIHDSYGIGNKIFTQAYFRSIVTKFIMTSNNLETYKQNAIVNAEKINSLFKKQIKTIEDGLEKENKATDLTQEQYVDIANALYKNFDNFLVKNIYSIPKLVDDYYTPFKPLQQNEIENYIKSNDYWANEVALEALSKELGLNIIPIERNDINKKSLLRIPYANFSSTNNNWTKYLFLYYNSNHFELLSFSHKVRTVKKVNNITTGVKFLPKKIVIFNRNNQNIIPPMYILFIIFGSYYFDQTKEFKSQFTFFPEIMASIQESFFKIVNSKTDVGKKFYELFKTFFPNTRYQYPDSSNLTQIDGGAVNPNPYYQSPSYYPPPSYYQPPPSPYYPPPPYPYYPPPSPYYQYPYYQYPYNKYQPENKMVKKEEQNEKSHIAYYVTIDMELHPGTSLTPEELKHIKCRQKWNTLNKSIADFRGKPYVIPPVYQQPKQPNRNNTIKNNNKKTRRQNIRGGYRSRTIRKL